MLISQLRSLQLKRFTGQLDITPLSGKSWKIYFFFGRIIWADGGCHPYRSWKRLLIQYCRQVTFETTIVCAAEKFDCWNYRLLWVLLERQQINRKQFTAIVKTKLIEVMFDILQLETSQNLTYKFIATSADYLLASGLKISSVLFPLDWLERQLQTLFISSNKYRQQWSEYCLNNCQQSSLNLAPSWRDKKVLAQKVTPHVYLNLVKFINGQRTLRDLAVMTNQDVLRFSCSVIPYLRQGWLELIEIPDLPKTTTTTKCLGVSGLFSPWTKTAQPLIACVDDSRMACAILNQIITQQGYSFLKIQDSLKATITLLKSNPDLIFLDLLMPVINGYELCAQLRQNPKFKDVPIIILTSRDGLIDRMRAKLVGATDFASKPIEEDKIIPILKKYLTPTQQKITQKSKPVLTLRSI